MSIQNTFSIDNFSLFSKHVLILGWSVKTEFSKQNLNYDLGDCKWILTRDGYDLNFYLYLLTNVFWDRFGKFQQTDLMQYFYDCSLFNVFAFKLFALHKESKLWDYNNDKILLFK